MGFGSWMLFLDIEMGSIAPLVPFLVDPASVAHPSLYSDFAVDGGFSHD